MEIQEIITKTDSLYCYISNKIENLKIIDVASPTHMQYEFA